MTVRMDVMRDVIVLAGNTVVVVTVRVTGGSVIVVVTGSPSVVMVSVKVGPGSVIVVTIVLVCGGCVIVM